MTLFQLFLVAVIQGITEFLPISSSGHLILLPKAIGSVDQGYVVDLSVHVGTLVAVIVYFHTDFLEMLGGATRLMRGKVDTKGAFLALCLAVSTVPVVLFGLFLKLTGLDDSLRSVAVIGWTMLGFGILLYVADQRGRQDRQAESWTLRHAVTFGLWQALALIPGTSRSGITITAGRLHGYARGDAARLSMLMSIPTTAMAAALVLADAARVGDMEGLRAGAIAGPIAFVAALLALHFMMRLLRSVSFTPYVIYRVILGAVLLVIAYG